jgi:hypothetical protein
MAIGNIEEEHIYGSSYWFTFHLPVADETFMWINVLAIAYTFLKLMKTLN